MKIHAQYIPRIKIDFLLLISRLQNEFLVKTADFMFCQ